MTYTLSTDVFPFFPANTPTPTPSAGGQKIPRDFYFIRALDNRWGVLKTFFICFAANYNWVPEKARLHASSYLVDLLDYLQTTFLNFTTLPVSWPSTSCFLDKACFPYNRPPVVLKKCSGYGDDARIPGSNYSVTPFAVVKSNVTLFAMQFAMLSEAISRYLPCF